MSDVRVRFAPSPTGELHIGGARTALFNYLYVRNKGGKFILRVDDTDLERSQTQYIDKLINSLKWLGLQWDEGPYYQSQRLDQYRKEAERLMESGKAYRCYCSEGELEEGRTAARKEGKAFLYPGNCRHLSTEQEERLQKEGRSCVIRLRTPDQGQTLVRDEIRGEVSFDNAYLDDFIIIKSNGHPTYNYASIIDDLQLKISDIIRAEEHLSNTPRQQLCAEALEYDLPRFAHVPMILAPDRSKLSKRHGATSVEEFYAEGYLPEALINYMALLGWSPGDDEEIMPLEEMINKFSLEKVNNTAAIYDVSKLAWLNNHYMREYDLEKLAEAALPFFESKGLIKSPLSGEDYDYFKQAIDLIRERSKTLVELAENSRYFYSDQFAYEEKGVNKQFRKENVSSYLRRLAGEIRSMEACDKESFEALYSSLSNELEISKGRLIHPSRLAVTGTSVGPGIFEILALLSQDKTAERLEKAADYIDNELS
ncbi:MAG: glutamate--tRNA ligase [Bacillota bacterium]